MGEFSKLNGHDVKDLISRKKTDLFTTPELYGAKGDGVNDDTLAIQECFNDHNGRVVLMYNTYKITNTIHIPSNIVIDCQGKIVFDGDVERILLGENCENVVIKNITMSVIKDFSERTQYNRAINFSECEYVEIDKCSIHGASTGIHILHGEKFVLGDCTLSNVFGKEPQYGYGVDTSCKNNIIRSITVRNDDLSHGRHALYLNGAIMESCTIGSVYVENWNKNPINIAISNELTDSVINIDTVIFKNVNYEPLSTTPGCIHISDINDVSISKVKFNLGKLDITSAYSTCFSDISKSVGTSVGDITVRSLPPATNTSSVIVYFRQGSKKSVRSIKVEGLNTDWLSCINCRDCIDCVCEDLAVYDDISVTPIRVNNSNLLVGNIFIKNNITPYTASNSGKLEYMSGPASVKFLPAIPTTGNWNIGDIIINSSPSAGEPFGWVCTSSGDPGTWNIFATVN
ncbi:MAG: hypothetical protein J6U90_04970 [Methanobrevibacter sp.]|nr:hypothetical protein [Methanobrevibacter sp.]